MCVRIMSCRSTTLKSAVVAQSVRLVEREHLESYLRDRPRRLAEQLEGDAAKRREAVEGGHSRTQEGTLGAVHAPSGSVPR